ncbi:MAG: histidine kinase [Actinomycetota bacterium]
MALVFVLLSVISSDDHTYGLVMVFGLAIPVTGAVAQVSRLRSGNLTAPQRSEARLLLITLGMAFAVAVVLTVVTTQRPAPNRTVSYEVLVPQAGTYFFRCDPHPQEMTGVVRVVEPGPGVSDEVTLVASQNLFDQRQIELPAGVLGTIILTNLDTELHNVAIYRDSTAAAPLFIGSEFSGSQDSRFAFRIFRALFALIPFVLVAGLVRFRLWDIERFINRTLAYSLVAGVITLTYLAVVTGTGAVLGSRGRADVAAASAGAALVAIAFQPVRRRAIEIANRLVYGRKSSPYEVLRTFIDRVETSFAIDEVLPKMARALGEGTSATHSEVWLKVGDDLVRWAAWPAGLVPAARPASEELDEGMIPVVHDGELLGAIQLRWPPGQKPTPVERELVAGVAAQAGLALSNSRLTAQLKMRVEELRASRQRIVSAQDTERRRIERDIHDGAQPALLAAGMKIGLAESMLETDPEGARTILQEAQESTNRAIGALRDLARGIYPPILAAKGLEAALEAHVRRLPVEIYTRLVQVGRYGTQVESAVYFCCLETLHNALKYGGRPVELSLEDLDGTLRFQVSDAGPGFDTGATHDGSGLQNMADRMAALGGGVDVTSPAGGPTRVTGWVPIQ